MSSIPKPSRLAIPRTVVPNQNAGATRAMTGKVQKPLAKPLAEANHNRTLKRAASPSVDIVCELTTMAKKAHLRRSKSSSDIRRVGAPNAPAPLRRALSKINLQPATSTLNLAGSRAKPTTSTTAAIANKARPAPTISRQRTQISLHQTTTTAPSTARRPGVAPSTAVKKPAAASAASAAGVAKKKIPPYDFKARYLDLSERHETLKDKYQKVIDDQEHLVEVEEKYDAAAQQLETLVPEVETLRVENVELREKKQLFEGKYQRAAKHLETLVPEAEQLRAKNMELHEDNQVLDLKVDRLATNLERTRSQYEETRGELEFLQQEHACSKEENETLKAQLKAAKEEGEFFKEEFFRIEMDRKRLHNTIMDLKGNIRVFCRIRPALDNESEKMLCQWNLHDESSFEVGAYDPQKRKNVKVDYTFDQVFHQRSTQEDVFENVSPLIQSALDGYNVCIFAYGQTGSGKSYTMDGSRDNLGIIPRTVGLLYDTIKHLNRCGWTYEIKASFLEIYNEVLCDLLEPKTKNLEIKMVSSNNQKDIYVSNIKEVTVKCARELREFIEVAKSNRITACTAGNERSSRSHAVTQITVIGRHRDRNFELTKGTINLVDLAGSESAKTSNRMDETKNINRSLSELTNVMLALVKKSNHVPYRNSKLTHLLMPSLGGNSKTLMIVNVNPLDDHFGETNKSLRFASTVNSCTMAKAKKVKILQEQDSVSSCRSDD